MQASLDNVYIPKRLQATQLNHIYSQVVNLYWLAHIQHINAAAARQCARFQHQLCGLRDRHKIARDVRMRDGDRATGLKILDDHPG